MQAIILNTIIIVSLLGILGLSAKDYFFPTKTTSEIAVFLTPTVVIETKKIAPNDKPTLSCANRYFNFQKGTTWKYRLTAEFVINKNKNKIDKTFVNTIIDTTPTAITIETKYYPEKNTKKTVVTCKETGLHGFPFPYGEEGLNVFFKPTILLPTEDKLVTGGEWQNPIDLKLPIPFLNFQLSLASKVADVSNKKVFGIKRQVVEIDSKLDAKSLPIDILKNDIDQNINSHFAENIGLLKADLTLNLVDIAKIKWRLQLLEFKEATASGLPKI